MGTSLVRISSLSRIQVNLKKLRRRIEGEERESMEDRVCIQQLPGPEEKIKR